MAEENKKDDIKEETLTQETEKVETAPEKEEVKEETPKPEVEEASKEEVLEEKKEEVKEEEKGGKEKEQEAKIGGSKWAKRQQGKRGKGGKRRGNRGDKAVEQKEFEEVVLKIDRVSRMMKGGRRMSFRASVVIGDKKGRVGFGMGKSNEVQGAIQKAVREARKNLVNVSLKDDRTIPHRIDHKFKAARIRIIPASEGTGVIAGGTIRAILELGGVKDCLSKNIGTNNKVTIAKATIEALQKMEGKGGKSERKEEKKSEKKPVKKGEKK